MPAAAALLAAAASARSAPCRCRPRDACWPPPAAWAGLNASVGGRLVRPTSPIAACDADASSAACATQVALSLDTYWLQEQAGGLINQGYLGAWNATVAAYAVAAESAADVSAAVRFAAARDLRVVVKGTGHDYLGRSAGADSLLVWTHRMRDISFDDAFRPAACGSGATEAAVHIGAGARWLEAYQAAQKRGLLLQGGGCTSVGAGGGFWMGGGFGSYSKRLGTGAGNVLEAEVVLADGTVVTADRCGAHKELFWALRGGGGGTFGVVTRVTMLAHRIDEATTTGDCGGVVQARDTASFRALLRTLSAVMAGPLLAPEWGEQISVFGEGDIWPASLRRIVHVGLVVSNISQADAERALSPVFDLALGDPEKYTVQAPLHCSNYPASGKWASDPSDPNRQPSVVPGKWVWSGDATQASQYQYSMVSHWIPAAAYADLDAMADFYYNASSMYGFSLHLNKGLAGAPPAVLAREAETSVHPASRTAQALMLSGGDAANWHLSLNGTALPPVADPYTGDPIIGAAPAQARSERLADLFRRAFPDSGAYGNEASFFEPDWQRALWGAGYARLLAAKRAADPAGLFTCHHCVGSEGWSADGMCRAG